MKALAKFLDTLVVCEAEILAILWTNQAMKRLSGRQQEKYNNAKRCILCRHEFVEGEAKGHKVRDHDHITGWFILTAHRQCNSERPVSFKIPVFFHNFRGYDAHLIVHEFCKKPDREIKVIGKDMKIYIKVVLGNNMVFLDSLQVLPASLEQLAVLLAKDGRWYFQNLHDVVTDVYPDANVELLERTRIFCYVYIDSFTRLDNPALLPREAFFNKFGGMECSQAEYAHAQHVWDNFHSHNLKEYIALYLLSDICRLPEVVQAFRNNSLGEYQLYPSYFVSTPQFAWNWLFKHIDWLISLITYRRFIGGSSRTSWAVLANKASATPR